MVAFDEVADELYGLPLTEFTAARRTAAGQARLDGDAELAKRIGDMRKPVVAGWLANQLARRHPDDIQSLVDLGETLRDAMRRLAGDELRQAAGSQQQAVYALVQKAERDAVAAGQGVSAEAKRGLEQTLHAALVDPAVAAELSAGRLTSPLSRSGFPELSIGDLAVSATLPAPSMRQIGGRVKAEEEDTEERARADFEAAAKAHADAQQSVEQLEQDASAARDKVQRLNEQLDIALNEQNRAEADLRRARRAAREAERAARRAAQRLSR